MIRKADEKDMYYAVKVVHQVLDKTLSKHYPYAVVHAWKDYMSLQRFLSEMDTTDFLVYGKRSKMLGVGAIEDDHIKRVYVLPEHQGRGIGTELVKSLE